MKLFARFRKAEAVETTPEPVIEPKPVRFARARSIARRAGNAGAKAARATGSVGAKVACATGRTVANVASDANTAVTTYRCARLARALQRNEALAATARETLS